MMLDRMKTTRAFLVLAFLVLAGQLVPVPAMAHDDDHDRARRAVQAGEVLPLKTILDAVARDFPGDVVETELEEDHGQQTYEIKLIAPDGQMMKIIYDAHDGSVLKVKGKRK